MENFKKHVAPGGELAAKPAIRSCDTGQRYEKFDISHWFPCNADGRTDERTDGRTDGHVITKMSRMDRLPNFLGYRAPRVELRCYIIIKIIYNIISSYFALLKRIIMCLQFITKTAKLIKLSY